jgi:prophage regulatory protein
MDSIIREPKVLELVGAGRSTVRMWEKEGSFPQRRKIGKRSVGWLKSEIEAWLSSRPQAGAQKNAYEG